VRAKSIMSGLVSLVLIAAGVFLVAYFFLSPGWEDRAANAGDPTGFNVPEIGASREEAPAAPGGPEDRTLTVTIPEMARIRDDRVPDAAGTDERALRENAAIHLKGTGFPWQEVANVYLAGHRLGYPNTESFLTFWDLDKLEKGDRVFIADAAGTEYTYRVFREFVVGPTELSITRPIPGTNIVTLQTCTLPDYSQRLIVQAELVRKAVNKPTRGDRA
jgi:sortase A